MSAITLLSWAFGPEVQQPFEDWRASRSGWHDKSLRRRRGYSLPPAESLIDPRIYLDAPMWIVPEIRG